MGIWAWDFKQKQSLITLIKTLIFLLTWGECRNINLGVQSIIKKNITKCPYDEKN